jgi:hypothetical protein
VPLTGGRGSVVSLASSASGGGKTSSKGKSKKESKRKNKDKRSSSKKKVAGGGGGGAAAADLSVASGDGREDAQGPGWSGNSASLAEMRDTEVHSSQQTIKVVLT